MCDYRVKETLTQVSQLDYQQDYQLMLFLN